MDFWQKTAKMDLKQSKRYTPQIPFNPLEFILPVWLNDKQMITVNSVLTRKYCIIISNNLVKSSQPPIISPTLGETDNPEYLISHLIPEKVGLETFSQTGISS